MNEQKSLARNRGAVPQGLPSIVKDFMDRFNI